MKKIKGGVTAPKGFAAMGLKAGIKKDKKDMAMIYSSTPCVAAVIHSYFACTCVGYTAVTYYCMNII